MKILVKDIPSQGSSFEGRISSRALDVDRDYWRLEGDARVLVDGYRIGDYVNLSIRVEADTSLVCTRCLEEASSHRHWQFSHQIKIVDELQEIDIADLVREEIILSIGIKALCKEDCQGICPVCGGNKNLGECKCD